MEQRFSLQPFPSGKGTPNITITGTIRRSNNKIEIGYTIGGDLQDIAIPSKADTQMRKHNLWKETCLEAFLAPEGSSHYWEVNISPEGCWNVYRFTAYRAGMKEESAVIGIPITVKNDDASLILSAAVDMNNLFSPDKPLHAGISAVIKSKSGTLSYWALAHPGPEADFHNRKSFVIRL